MKLTTVRPAARRFSLNLLSVAVIAASSAPWVYAAGPVDLPFDSTHNQAQQGDAPAAPPGVRRPAVTPADFARFDALGEPGLSIIYPPSSDSFLGDIGGWRSKLADHDMALEMRSTTVLNYDVLQRNPNTPQVYAGQKPTVQSYSTYATFTAGLASMGLPNSKLSIGVISFGSTWSASQGETELRPRFDKIAYYQSFADKTVEIKTGYMVNYLEFIGVFTGGSPMLTTGLSSLVPVEVGLSADPAPAPTFKVTVNGPDGLYYKGGVQRSSSPFGQEYQAGHDGGLNLRWSARRAKPLYINEFGINRPSGPDQRSLWVRTGAIYNTSNYTRFDNGEYKDNYAAFLLGDYQIAQPYPDMPWRGVNIGASAFYADKDVNVISQYYEARLYSLGLFESRPLDGITFNLNHSVYSRVARNADSFAALNAAAGQWQTTVSYSAHLMKGLYLSPNLSLVHNPAFGDYDDALTVGVNLFLNF